MIVHIDVQASAGLANPSRAVDVLTTGSMISAWVVVDHDKPTRAKFQRSRDDSAHVEGATVDAAMCDCFASNEDASGVEKQHSHLFEREIAEVQPKVGYEIGPLVYKRSHRVGCQRQTGGVPINRHHQSHRFTRDLSESRRRGVDDAAQGSKFTEQGVRNFACAWDVTEGE